MEDSKVVAALLTALCIGFYLGFAFVSTFRGYVLTQCGIDVAALTTVDVSWWKILLTMAIDGILYLVFVGSAKS